MTEYAILVIKLLNKNNDMLYPWLLLTTVMYVYILFAMSLDFVIFRHE